MIKKASLMCIIIFTFIPMSQVEATAQSTGFIYNVNIDGQGTVAYIPPSTDFSVSFNYNVWNGWEGGAGCIVYIAMGIGYARDSLRTTYNPAKNCGVPGYFPGGSGSATLTTRTPTTMAPGTPYGIFLNFYEVSSASQACQVFRNEYRSVAGHYPAYGVIIRASSIEEQEENTVMDLHITPNPSSGKTSIKLNLKNNETASIKLYNVTGQLIRTLTTKVFTKGEHLVIWNHRDNNNNIVPSGIYSCEIKTDNGKIQQQLITIE